MYEETILDRYQLPSAAKVIASEGMTLMTMVASDERHRGNGFVVRYAFANRRELGSKLTVLCAKLPDDDPHLPSVTTTVPAANWYEREAHDMLGIEFEGHPDARPLVYHGAWPRGTYPLRKDFDAASVRREVECGCDCHGGYLFNKDDISGVMEVPVGPIHAGIIEPGHFRFTTVGETVHRLEARLFFTHRGVEKAAEHMDVHTGLCLAERICGACSFSHSLSYAQAVEDALGINVPRRARQLRTLLMELERLYNHVGDLGNICAGVGYAFGISQLGILKERLMELNEKICGNRFLRGINAVGGLRKEVAPDLLDSAWSVLDDIVDQFSSIVDTISDSDSFQDRITGTGILARETAVELAVVGPAARSAGVDTDSRRDFPHAAYDEVDFEVPIEETGDVAARIAVRVHEVIQSRSISRQVLSALVTGPVQTDECFGVPSDVKIGMGISESARGSNVHWVMLDESGLIERFRVRSASFCNWPVVPSTVPGNIVPDFPLINKSFELCYSCLDR